jgi:subtilisin family serine protease
VGGWYATHTTQAWDITRGDPSVVVAILDTGLKTQGLSDYDGQVVTGWNVMRNSTDTSTFAGNHGTYVAGVVGLALGNGTGNAGFCPGCKVMPVQVGTDAGATWSDLAAGITWAADHGARVENMSWAGTSPSSTLANAVAYARSRGIVLTAAAGNSNCDCPTYPSATPGVIGVAGSTKTDSKESDSNYGNWVKVAAPETNMTSWPTLNGLPGYAPVGGTSLAAPVVAAIAGLLFSANPAPSGTQIEQALEASAVPVGFSVQYGRVDALGALNYLGFSDPQPASAPRNTAAPSIYVETNGDYNYRPLVVAPETGNVLLRGQGSWDGSAPLQLNGLRWERCDAIGSACATRFDDREVHRSGCRRGLRLSASRHDQQRLRRDDDGFAAVASGRRISACSNSTSEHRFACNHRHGTGSSNIDLVVWQLVGLTYGLCVSVEPL